MASRPIQREPAYSGRFAVCFALVLCGSCRSFELPLSVKQTLQETRGAYVEGRPEAFGKARVLNAEDFIYDVAWSTDGTRLLLSRLGHRAFFATVVDVTKTTAPVVANSAVNPYELDVEAVEFSPDGTIYGAVSRDGHLRLFDAATGVLRGSFSASEPLTALAFHPSSAMVLVGSARGLLVAVSVADLKHRGEWRAHEDEIRALSFLTPELVLSGSWDKSIVTTKLTETQDLVGGRWHLHQHQRYTMEGCVNDLSLSRDHTIMAVALSNVPAVRTPEVYERERQGEEEAIHPANVAARVEVATGRVLGVHDNHRGVVSTVAIHPSGDWLVSGGWDKTVRLQGGTSDDEYVAGWIIRKVRFSPDGSSIAVAAWTPQKPYGDRQSDPAAFVLPIRYVDATVVSPAAAAASPPVSIPQVR